MLYLYLILKTRKFAKIAVFQLFVQKGEKKFLGWKSRPFLETFLVTPCSLACRPWGVELPQECLKYLYMYCQNIETTFEDIIWVGVILRSIKKSYAPISLIFTKTYSTTQKPNKIQKPSRCFLTGYWQTLIVQQVNGKCSTRTYQALVAISTRFGIDAVPWPSPTLSTMFTAVSRSYCESMTSLSAKRNPSLKLPGSSTVSKVSLMFWIRTS